MWVFWRARGILPRALVLCALAGLAACGGVAEECMGTQLSDEQLCQLTCKVTTPDQATALLGAPTTSVAGGGLWSYYCPASAGGVDLVSINLIFSGVNGTLIQVSRSGNGKFAAGKLPACLSACAR